MTQPALFDPRTTTDQHCPVPGCQAIRFAAQERTPTCAHDLERATGTSRRRPSNCLNQPQPSQEIPY